MLELPTGAPVLLCRRTTFSDDGVPVLHSEHVFPGHRTEFAVALPRADRSIAPSGLRLVDQAGAVNALSGGPGRGLPRRPIARGPSPINLASTPSDR